MRNPQHLTWDYAAALHACEVLKSLEALLTTLTDERLEAARIAKETWRGPHRIVFDESFKRRVNEAYDLIERCRTTRALINQAIKNVEAEERRRADIKQREDQLRGLR